MKLPIKKTLEDLGLKPKKGLGQNFLVDTEIFNKIIQAAELGPQDIVVEVGPGLGILTLSIAEKVKKVIAIEKDKDLIRALKIVVGSKAEIINDDILKTKELKYKQYKIVANLPYYITSPFIRKFLEAKNPPQEMILMVQKEVAQRICSSPPKMSILAIATQFYSRPRIKFYVLKQSFWPEPKVDSAIIKISNIKKPKIGQRKFFKVVKAGFSHPRKLLVSNLAKELDLPKEKINQIFISADIDPMSRAQNLSIDNWKKIVRSL